MSKARNMWTIAVVLSFVAMFDGIAQKTSYQISIDDNDKHLWFVLPWKDGKAVAILTGPPLAGPSVWTYVLELSSDGVPTRVTRISTIGISSFFWMSDAAISGDKLFILSGLQASAYARLLILDLESGDFWSEGFEFVNAQFLVNDQTERVIIFSSTNYIELDSNGDMVFNREYDLVSLSIDPSLSLPSWQQPISIVRDTMKGFVAFKSFQNSAGELESFLHHLDQDGDVLKSLRLKNFRVDAIQTDSDGLYLVGKHISNYAFSNNTYDLLVLKLRWDFTVEWSRVYFAEEFEYNTSTIVLSPSQKELILSYSTYGAFPVIFARLTRDGEIKSQTGYPLYQPLLELFFDNSLLMGTNLNFDSLGNTFPQVIISKTDTLGQIENCPTYVTCLQEEEVSYQDYEFVTVTSEIVETYEVEDENFVLDTTQFETREFCEFPGAPAADFFPGDTILCSGDSLHVFSQGALISNGNQWHLTGPGVDTFIVGSSSFRWYFQEVGIYMLKHVIWSLGCASEFSSSIEVLAPLSVSIQHSSKPQCTPPIGMTLHSNRPLTNLTWSTGDTTAAINILQGGHYSVTATDGYCDATDSIDVVFVSETLGGQPPLELPPDTTVCRQHLPYMLSPQSSFTDSFLVNGRLHVNSPAALSRPGDYEVVALIEGCAFPDTFRLDTSACHVKVYFPNAFSPNGDGINDVYRPLAGDDAEMLELWIFDRWGGLRHHGEAAKIEWDGRGAPPGTYVAKLKFKNLLTGLVETREAGFTLMR